jgi:energy-coupling factor transporter ATP-binding protein EcfA2
MSAQLPAPYVGLRPFEFSEAAIFYGRGEHIASMARTLRKGHFLAVVGSSGSGKSSLVRAGLLPAIAGGFMNDGDDEPDWRFVLMRPGRDPYENLLTELLPQLAPDQALDPALVDFRRRTLRGGPRGMVEVVADSLLPESTRLVVLVDQFEEIFRFLERGRPRQPGDPMSSADQRNAALAFVDMVLATAAERDRRIYVVLTMRSEYLGECEAFLGLSAAIAKHQFLTPRMTREQLQDVVERPIKAFGGTIEPLFVTGILNSLGTAQDQLPRVEHVLLRMWDHELQEQDGEPPALRMEDYRAIGGFESALDQHAEQLFSALGAEQQRVAEQLFRALAARTSQGTLVRRLSTVDEVASIAGVSEQLIAEVVEHFRQPGANFLVATPAGAITGKTTLDISHESLLRQWIRLGKWVAAEADAATELQRLARDADSWNEGKRGFLGQPELGLFQKLRKECFPSREWASRYVKPREFDLADQYLRASLDEQEKSDQNRKQDRRKQELRRGGIVVCLILLLLVIPLAVYSNHLRIHAMEKARDAERESVIAGEQRKEADIQRDKAKQKTDEAEEAAKQLAQAIEKEALVDRIIRIVQVVRTLAELGASQSDAEFDVALNRWEVLAKLIREQESKLPEHARYVTNCLNKRFPRPDYPNGLAAAARPTKDKLGKPKSGKGEPANKSVMTTKQWVEFLREQAYYVAHDLRNELLTLKEPEIKKVVEKELKYVRDISSQRIERCVTSMLEMFQYESFDDAAPYVREFWLNYYGDFGLTEGTAVAQAMADFGEKLKEIEKKLPAFALADGLAAYRVNVKARNADEMPITSLIPAIHFLVPNSKQLNLRAHEANEHFRKYSRMVYLDDLKELAVLRNKLKHAIDNENKPDVPVAPYREQP